MKPDERNKIIALVAGIVVVFGVGGFNIVRLMGGGGSDASPTPAPPVTPEQQVTVAPTQPLLGGSPSPDGANSGTLVQSGQEMSPSPGIRVASLGQEPSPLPVNAANPFRPIESKSQPVPAPTPAPIRISESARSYTPPRRQEYNPSVSQMRVAPKNQEFSQRSRPVVPEKTTPRASAARSERDYLAAIPLELVGVVEGESGACALIKLKDEQVLVGVGERISEFRVEKIDLDSVTLVHSRLRRTLRVGADGTSNNSMSEPESKETALLLPVTEVTAKRSSLFQQSPVAECPSLPESPERLEPFEGQP